MPEIKSSMIQISPIPKLTKLKRAQQLRLCSGCLEPGHGTKGCTNPNIKSYKFYEKKHYHALCIKPKATNKTETEVKPKETTLALTTPKERTILSTLMLPLIGKWGKITK